MSAYVVAPLIAWLCAQTTKVVLSFLRKGKKGDLSMFYKSGNMPSSHTAMVTAFLIVVGAIDGVDSGLFGLSAVTTLIVVYDALNVRRAVGEQGIVLKSLLEQSKRRDNFFMAQGHLWPEVVMGCVIGVAAAVISLQIL